MTATGLRTEDERAVRADALPLTGPASLDPMLERIGGARFVAIGEASHGTSGFYRWRAELTRRLIAERGFSFVAVEGDWPDCAALHHCVTGAPGAPADPAEVLLSFDRWPRWMWANTDVLGFARWLRTHNLGRPPGRRAGFFGLDVYSLWDSLHAVLGHLRRHDPGSVRHARAAERCFEPYGGDPQAYARATRLVPGGCEQEVVSLLALMRNRAAGTAAGTADGDGGFADFAARQNAEVLAGAERYYREMVRGGPEAWNVRDRHMADTLDRLAAYHGPDSRAVVWEHNTHVGDARATDMARAGMVNVGQLLRERHAADGVVLAGFGSYEGTVIAAGSWGDTPRVMRVPPAREGSVEYLLHRALPEPAALFLLGDGAPPGGEDGAGAGGWQRRPLDHRAIGVVHDPGGGGVYVPTVLAGRYDAFLHLDHTEALTPLHPDGPGRGEEETYPTGF
ncbi:erythromycin esterase family protein [Streptomyces xinghaiensis]|uniref:erythromycin esterase family protein n=1 Tax=Streptomyces xinghaiensis TaxID=1038928 RepID=UPI003441FB61